MVSGEYLHQGTVYNGNFVGGIKNGHGSQISCFGDKYIGNFVNGRPRMYNNSY